MKPEHADVDPSRGHAELSCLAEIEPTLPAAPDWLTGDEHARLASIGAPLRRRQFLAGHWLARRLGGAVLAIDPARIGMDRDPDGRPRLRVDGAVCAWHVSLTHSDDRIAAVVAPHPVGIDLEVPRRARDLAALARFTFSPDEVARLDAVPAAARVSTFYALWALKEARGKRCGEGILPRRARCATAEPARAEDADAVTWTVDDVTLAVVTTGAAALRVSGVAAEARVAWWRIAEAMSAD